MQESASTPIEVPDMPVYPGYPQMGIYACALLSKKEGVGSFQRDGKEQTVAEIDARVAVIGGRPGESIACAYDLMRLRYQKFDAMKSLTPGDRFIMRVYNKKSNDGLRSFREAEIFPVDFLTENLEKLDALMNGGK